MALFDISDFPRRPHVEIIHVAAISAFGKAGTWLDSATRVKILDEARSARDCLLCSEQKRSLSPFAVKGEHLATTDLDQVTVEIVHRLRNNADRLTFSWFESILAQGVSAEQYVEIVGLVSTAIIIDGFACALGHPIVPAPQADVGVPTRKKNDKVVEAGAWFPIMDVETEETTTGLPKVPNIFRAMGLVPESVRHFFSVMSSQYSLTPFETSLDRSQVEYIAAKMSSHNQCFY